MLCATSGEDESLWRWIWSYQDTEKEATLWAGETEACIIIFDDDQAVVAMKWIESASGEI